MLDDISFLVQETLKEIEKTRFDRGLITNFFGKSTEEDVNVPEEVPGVLFHLQKKTSTFVIRLQESSNLKEDFKNIMKHPEFFPSLRMSEGEESFEEKLSFFECDNIEVAKMIKDHLSNKRFPMHEEHVFNVSDPGDSWWLRLEENKISVHFKLSQTDKMDGLLKLGPLGNDEYHIEILNKLFGYFKMIFPVGDYSCGSSQWSVTCSEANNLNFENLKLLFSHGETSYDFWEILRRLEQNAKDESLLKSLQQANFYMMKLSCMRHFWKTIQNNLNEQSPNYQA